MSVTKLPFVLSLSSRRRPKVNDSPRAHRSYFDKLSTNGASATFPPYCAAMGRWRAEGVTEGRLVEAYAPPPRFARSPSPCCAQGGNI